MTPLGECLRDLILNSDPSAAEPGQQAALAYDATRLALAAIAQAAAQGPLTRETVAQALAQITFEGVTGPVAFLKQGPFEHFLPNLDAERFPVSGDNAHFVGIHPGQDLVKPGNAPSEHRVIP